tara:strand:+ start:907 stop:2307 length:1401 start_codon:yes stop_codon:yes gene_type:complete
MRILIFIEHSAIIRHFIDSKAFSLLEKKHELFYVFPLGNKRLNNLKKNDIKIDSSKIINLPVNKKRVSLWGKRFSVEALRMKIGFNKKIEFKQTKNNRRIFKATNPYKLYLVYRFLGLPFIFRFFTILINKILSQNPNIALENLIKTKKPDLLIHPSVLSGVYINDLVEIGNKSKIPLVVIMNSWDNPCSKRSVVSNNYYLLVWGPQTKMHAKDLMKMPENKIIEFGAAQFDVYKKYPKKNKNDILSFHGILEKNRPTLLYAGSSKSTDEFSHLKKIDDAITLKKLPSINLIYRPHPWGEAYKDSLKFKEIKFKNIFIDKNMRNFLFKNKNNEGYYSSKYSDTKDLLYAVDAVISPLSTILIEALIIGKPPLCFMPIEEKGAAHFQMAKKSVHFNELLSMREILVVWGGGNLINGISDLINRINDKNFHRDLKKSSRFFVKQFSNSFNKRIVDLAEEIYLKNKKGL